MSRKNARVSWFASVAILALGLLLPTARSAVDSQIPTQDRAFDAELPPWRIDFKKADPGSSEQVPPEFFVYEREDRTPTSEKPKSRSDGASELSIPLGNRLHPKLLELLRDDGITCELELGGGSAGVLTREDSSGAHTKDDADLIRLRKLKVGETNDADRSGWIELAVTNTIKKGQDAELKLTIHDWRALRLRVGAGVFTGALTLTLQNRILHNNEKLRIRQPLTLVIAGSRLVPEEREGDATKTVRVGTRITSRAQIESVETDDTNAANELDAGWWLQLTEEKHGGEGATPCSCAAAAYS